MKNIITVLILLSFSTTIFSQPMSLAQNLWFDVKGVFSTPVKRDITDKAKMMKDLNNGYPSAWIKESDYISTEVLTTCNGKNIKAFGRNDVLTEEQRANLVAADMFSEIFVEVKYKMRDTGTNVDTRTMNFAVTIVPDIEAEYCDGYEGLKAYLLENAVSKIPETNTLGMNPAKVGFTINEEGEVIDVKILESTKHRKTDEMLLEVVKNMPKWKPAENSNGEKFKQKFEFLIGGGC